MTDFHVCLTGEKRLNQVLEAAAAQGSAATISGAAAFELYDTYGFPLEITQEVAAERGIQVSLCWSPLECTMTMCCMSSQLLIQYVDMLAPALGMSTHVVVSNKPVLPNIKSLEGDSGICRKPPQLIGHMPACHCSLHLM